MNIKYRVIILLLSIMPCMYACGTNNANDISTHTTNDNIVTCVPVSIDVCEETIVCPWFESSLWSKEKTIRFNKVIQVGLFGWAEDYKSAGYKNLSFNTDGSNFYSNNYMIYIIADKYLSVVYDYYYSYIKNGESNGKLFYNAVVFDIVEERIVGLNELFTFEDNSYLLTDKFVPILYNQMEMDDDEAYINHKNEIDYANASFFNEIVNECNITPGEFLETKNAFLANKSFYWLDVEGVGIFIDYEYGYEFLYYEDCIDYCRSRDEVILIENALSGKVLVLSTNGYTGV